MRHDVRVGAVGAAILPVETFAGKRKIITNNVYFSESFFSGLLSDSITFGKISKVGLEISHGRSSRALSFQNSPRENGRVHPQPKEENSHEGCHSYIVSVESAIFASNYFALAYHLYIRNLE